MFPGTKRMFQECSFQIKDKIPKNSIFKKCLHIGFETLKKDSFE
jgi:hypothetical protein